MVLIFLAVSHSFSRILLLSWSFVIYFACFSFSSTYRHPILSRNRILIFSFSMVCPIGYISSVSWFDGSWFDGSWFDGSWFDGSFDCPIGYISSVSWVGSFCGSCIGSWVGSFCGSCLGSCVGSYCGSRVGSFDCPIGYLSSIGSPGCSGSFGFSWV